MGGRVNPLNGVYSQDTAHPQGTGNLACIACMFSASLPFETPATGRIAVKVINHYSDEALKAYDV
jgi:hypothetical protein